MYISLNPEVFITIKSNQMSYFPQNRILCIRQRRNFSKTFSKLKEGFIKLLWAIIIVNDSKLISERSIEILSEITR